MSTPRPRGWPELIFILAEMRAVPGNHQQDGHSAPAVERTNAMWLEAVMFSGLYPSKIGPQRLPSCPSRNRKAAWLVSLLSRPPAPLTRKELNRRTRF